MTPKVTVVMPVYNRPEYVREAIDSILGQTLADLELIVVDDGSQEETLVLLRSYTDTRVRTFTQTNQGPAVARNRALDAARGAFVAFQDSDDVALPRRLEKEIDYLERHESCGLVGTWARIWRDQTPTDRNLAHPVNNAELQFELLFDNPFVATSVVVRREVLSEVGAFDADPTRLGPEDYQQWARIARRTAVANLPEELLVYRELEGSVSRRDPIVFRNRVIRIAAEQIGWAADIDPKDSAVADIAALTHGAPEAVVGEPDFGTMREVLLRAALVVTGGDRRFAEEAVRRIDSLRQAWRARHRGRGWRGIVRRPLRPIVRHLPRVR